MPPPLAISSVAVPIATYSWSSLPTLPTAQPLQAPVIPAPDMASRRGLILSPAADPIPHRLVHRIQSGDFVEMRDLLADNVALHDQLEDLHGSAPLAATPLPFRPRLREIPSLHSWMYCFAAYVAVRSGDPVTRELLAYSHLIIREALRHGGNGWQEYDRSFRRHRQFHTLEYAGAGPPGRYSRRIRDWCGGVLHLVSGAGPFCPPMCLIPGSTTSVADAQSHPTFVTGQLHAGGPSNRQAAASPGDSFHHLCFMEPGHLRLPRNMHI